MDYYNNKSISFAIQNLKILKIDKNGGNNG